MYKELMNKSLDELQTMFVKNLKEINVKHDMAVLIGSLGMSPYYYSKYVAAIDEIEKQNQ